MNIKEIFILALCAIPILYCFIYLAYLLSYKSWRILKTRHPEEWGKFNDGTDLPWNRVTEFVLSKNDNFGDEELDKLRKKIKSTILMIFITPVVIIAIMLGLQWLSVI